MVVQGGTWQFDFTRDTFHQGVSSLDQCQQMCRDDPICLAYTFSKASDNIMTYCYLFRQLGEMIECDNCESGTVPAYLSAGKACEARTGDFLDGMKTQTAKECVNLCLERVGCAAFTWAPSYCFLYSQCDDEMQCDSCVSGRVNRIPAPQCFNYLVLNEDTRNDRFQGIGDRYGNPLYYYDRNAYPNPSPNWKGSGYYRMNLPAGLYIPESNPGGNFCGTKFKCYLNGTHPEELFVEKNVNFGRQEGSVTNCNGYYVYYLPDSASSSCRYCATSEPIN